jgi:hypothetical protein
VVDILPRSRKLPNGGGAIAQQYLTVFMPRACGVCKQVQSEKQFKIMHRLIDLIGDTGACFTTGLKYRFLLRDYVQNAVFSKNYIQKCYNIYTFA